MLSPNKAYQDAMRKLNLLQVVKESRYDDLKKLYEKIAPFQDMSETTRCTHLEDMENYLLRTGVTLTDLEELSVIHIAGTKGKGSTSAMCESILRHHGYRTGFFSGPHLVTVRERFRLDGHVISEDMFLKYFHQVYDLLERTKSCEDDMPQYHKFLTVMAYNLFLKEKVDVAIVEVMIGGFFDCTNVLRTVPVVGITSLALDHTHILGNTLSRITVAKAGIMKPGCVVYTVKQPREAMDVFEDVANRNKCPLTVVLDYKSYTVLNPARTTNLPKLNLEAFQTNASLAIQLAHAWMRIDKLPRQDNIKTHLPKDRNSCLVQCLTEETVKGLMTYKWPGRCQVVTSEYAHFYLDGAHTIESIGVCVEWFKNNSRREEKILIFHTRCYRNAEPFLQLLVDIGFKTVYFVIANAFKEISLSHDNYRKENYDDLLAVRDTHAAIWVKLHKDCVNNVIVSGCVNDALDSIKNSGIDMPSVLITGSMYVVGAALSILDPNIN